MPSLNPGRITSLINENMSLFTSGISYSSLISNTLRSINLGWVQGETFKILFIGCMLVCAGVIGAVVGGCTSLGSLKLRRLGNVFAIIGNVISLIGFGTIRAAYSQISMTAYPERVNPEIPIGFYIIMGLIIFILVLSLILLIVQPKPSENDEYELQQKYKLFLLIIPFIALVFVFSYLPLWGWRYAFFDYKAGGTLSKDNYVGFKWFKFLLENKATRNDIVRVLRNTLAMSGLGLATSWCSMAFAILLCEIKQLRIRRFIQTFTTVPNFISWVLVYSFATLIFSSEGIISNIIVARGGIAVNYLLSDQHTWLKMLVWGMWKGIGWSAIVYIAGISGIDQQLYEAATVDGAGRFRKMWHITVPGLLPTYFVLLLLQISGILSNGMEQYLVFENPNNTREIMVLDLYVYKLGIGSGKIPLTTVVGMVKSIVSVTLLLGANKFSKLIRGESLI
ncbi:MAG TPA: sugar ABC transporter permease [Clostridiales bacterium]|jgi:putative aldouronate transport system permease protein|nr:sugar ABC transporter permease [Clostridiales bacterium]